MHRSGNVGTLAFAALFVVLSAWQIAVRNLGFNSEGLGILAAAGITIFIFSFLYEDNPLFKIGENLYVGIAAGYGTVQVWYLVFLGDLIEPLTSPHAAAADVWLRAVPTVLGLMLVARLIPGLGWMSRLSFAFVVGFGAGVSIPSYIASQLLEQIYPTLAPPMHWDRWDVVLLSIALVLLIIGAIALRNQTTVMLGGWVGPLVLAAVLTFSFFIGGGSAALVLVGVVAVLVYFFFSVEHAGAVGAVSRIGIWFLMVAFGASFGFTIMARISLLIGRMQFLLGDWLRLL